MSTPQHCPGFHNFKSLKSFNCKCPECGQEKEIFSDEFDRAQCVCVATTDFNELVAITLAGKSS